MRKIVSLLLICFIILTVGGCWAAQVDRLELSSKDLKKYQALHKKQDEKILQELTPLEVVKLYFYALYEQDDETAKLLVVDSDQGALKMFRELVQAGAPGEKELIQSTLASIQGFELTHETAETAFVKFNIDNLQQPGEVTKHEVKLERQDDAWKLVLGQPLLENKN